jgi:serine protease Do
MNLLRLTVLSACFAGAALSDAQTVKDREGAVRGDRAKMEGNERWIYNDVDSAFAAAKLTGKPLMVVLRCVPCMACMGLDAQVLLENSELKPLMDQFVRVRVINANSLDMSKFQFDYDLSFSTLFFNGDGTLYGRYGSWEHQHDSQNRATATLKQALAGALALHQGYPQNKSTLAGKQGRPFKYQTPVAMPTLQGKYRKELNWDGKVVQSCVHCHQVGDAIRLSYRSRGQALPLKWIYPQPAPDAIGLQMSPHQATEVFSVSTGSTAARSGIVKGDRIVSVMGQPVISTADISWALNDAPDAGTILITTKRNGSTTAKSLRLPDGWRGKSDISRRVGTWPMRAMASGGIKLDDLTDEERRERGLGTGGLALLAKHVGRYGKHGAAKRQGFQNGDVIIAIDGRKDRMTESEFIGIMIANHQPGKKVPATVLRGKGRLNLKIPVQ